jgi:geranylgeranyl diphosphate synthase type II
MVKISDQAAVPAAASLEMLHCFTLIHDDLPCMDNDDFRRGRPSNHKQFGEGIALLAGDALMALAIETFLDASPHVAHPLLLRGLSRFVWAMGPRGVTGGQAAEALLSPQSKLEELSLMHQQKTGALFSASILIPMDFAGIKEDSSEGLALELFAKELGLSFQVVDDLDDEAEGVPPDPKSILFYVDRASAMSNTLMRLEAAIKSLNSNWGYAAVPLLQIAAEVTKKLESPNP